MTYDEAIDAFRQHSPEAPLDWTNSAKLLAEAIEALGKSAEPEVLATLVGVGAVLYKQGFKEMQAAARTDIRFGKRRWPFDTVSE